jgi:hypothetical protein
MNFLFLLILFAQYGKNKLQYEDFSFYYIEGDKFTIYYQKDSKQLANFAYQTAQKTISELEEVFKFKLKRKIPIIIYNSFNQFQQTNIILDLIEEGILGFSEIFKNRVVLYFTGSYEDFYYTLRHELAHSFQYEYYWKGLAFFFSELILPSWYVEGMSEYLSKRRSLINEAIAGDLLISGKFIPLSQLEEGNYLNYVLGEQFFIFLENRYSEKKVWEFFREVKKRKGIEGAVKKVFGKSFSSLEKDFEEYLKEKYFPLIYKKKNFQRECKIVVCHQKEKRKYNTLPQVVSDDEVIYLAYEEKPSIFSYSLSQRKSKLILKGFDFLGEEFLSFLSPGIFLAKNKKYLYFIRNEKGKVFLCKYDLKKKKNKKFPLAVDYAYALNVSPNEKWAVFVGLKRGENNLYLYDLENSFLTPITADFNEKKDPYFLNNDTLIFVSENKICLYSLKGKEIKTIYKSEKNLSSPIALSENLDTLLFVEDYALTIYSLKANKVLYQSDFLGICQSPTIFKNKIYFSYYHDQGYSICQIDNFYDLIKEGISKKESLLIKEKGFAFDTILNKEEKPYTFSLSPDYFYGYGYFSSGLGLVGNIFLSFSDLLGNHRFILLTDLTGMIDFSNFYFSYSYLKRKEDYYFSLFQYSSFYNLKKDTVLMITERGILPTLSYPFGKFLRSDFSFLYYLRSWRFYYLGEEAYELLNKRLNLKFFFFDWRIVYDNARFLYFGPIKGERFLLGNYLTLPLSDLFFNTFYFETRDYFPFYKTYIFSFFFSFLKSVGKNKESFLLGGDYVRGYPYFLEDSLYYSPTLISSKMEFRYPFIEILKLGFPLPITIKNIRGVLFYDWGTNFNKFISSAGFGLRFFVSYFPFMIDFAYPLQKIEERGLKITFGIKEDW